jgi:hypothetical protein
MKSTRRDALTAGGIVFALALAGLAVFLFSGSGEAVLFFAGGVPVILLVGGLLWHRRVTRSSSETSPRIESRSRDLADDLEELLETYERLDRETPWNPSEHADQIEDLKRGVENRGFSVTAGNGGYDVEVVEYQMGEGQITQYQTNVGNILEDRLRAGFREFVESKVGEMNEGIERLRDADLLAEPESEAMTVVGADAGEPTELTERLESHQEEFRDRLGDAVARVHDVAGEPVVDRATLEAYVADGQYRKAADHVIEVAAEIEDAERSEFQQKRAELEDLIETVQSSSVAGYASDSLFQKIDDAERELADLDSAFDLDRLESELRPQVLSACAEIISDLQNELTAYLGTFSDADAPPDYFERPAVLDRSPREELRDAPDLRAFRSRWEGFVDDFVAALDEAADREGAILAYDDASGKVERTLATEGEVTPGEVPYNPAAPMMELYAYRNDDVTYLESRPALTQGADVAAQEFDLTVEVRLDPPETRDVTVETTIRDERRRLTRTIDGAGTFEFDPLLGGSATVTVSTDDDRYGRRETEVTLDRDRTVDVTLAEETAIDRLCDGMRTDAELLLDEVAGRVDARYDQQGYLTDGMDIGVQDKYRPCVLALWADDAGLSVREESDGVLVYDRERLETQLADLIDQKLPDENEMYYDDIRERYLTVPASDELLCDLLRQVETEVDFEWTDEKVVIA